MRSLSFPFPLPPLRRRSNVPGIQFLFDLQSKKVDIPGVESSDEAPALFAKIGDDILLAGRVMIGEIGGEPDSHEVLARH